MSLSFVASVNIRPQLPTVIATQRIKSHFLLVNCATVRTLALPRDLVRDLFTASFLDEIHLIYSYCLNQLCKANEKRLNAYNYLVDMQ